jgi:hypothetical protein
MTKIGEFYKTKRNGDIYVVDGITETGEIKLSWMSGTYRRVVSESGLARCYESTSTVEKAVSTTKEIVTPPTGRPRKVDPDRRIWRKVSPISKQLKIVEAPEDGSTAVCQSCHRKVFNEEILLARGGWESDFKHICHDCARAGGNESFDFKLHVQENDTFDNRRF